MRRSFLSSNTGFFIFLPTVPMKGKLCLYRMAHLFCWRVEASGSSELPRKVRQPFYLLSRGATTRSVNGVAALE